MTNEQLRTALAEAALSQAEFARRIGVDRQTVYRWCAGIRPVPQIAVLALRSIRPRTKFRRR